MLGAKYDADGDKISSLSGQNGSIVEGKSYNFIQNLSINTYMDEISSNGGTIIFQCNGNKGRAVTYEGQNNTYKVIYSTFVFGGVREESAKNELMKIYMDYLLGTGDQQAPVVSVTLPSGGEDLQPGTTFSIEWTATDNVGVVSRAIYFTDDNGSDWAIVDSAAGNTGSFDWTVPTTSSADCMIKVFAYDAAGNVGANESAQFGVGGSGVIPNAFNIKPAGTYKVTITNVQGRVVSSFKTKNLNVIQIKKSLPSGLHIVHVMTSKEKVSKKFLIVR